jgi:hypothetical protein
VSVAASLVALNALSDASYPMPGAKPPAIRRYFSQEHRAARLGAVAQLASAASLSRFTASVAALAARSGHGSRGLRAASVAGGALATASLATSALTTVTLTTTRAEQGSSADALYRLMFVTGGPVHGDRTRTPDRHARPCRVRSHRGPQTGPHPTAAKADASAASSAKAGAEASRSRRPLGTKLGAPAARSRGRPLRQGDAEAGREPVGALGRRPEQAWAPGR